MWEVSSDKIDNDTRHLVAKVDGMQMQPLPLLEPRTDIDQTQW